MKKDSGTEKASETSLKKQQEEQGRDRSSAVQDDVLQHPSDEQSGDVSAAEEATIAPSATAVESSDGDDADEVLLLEKQVAAHWERILRQQAEMENLRKRHHKDLEMSRDYAVEALVGALLPVKDSLEKALEMTVAKDPHAEGLQLTLQMWEEAFKQADIEALAPLAERFDPACQQAVRTEHSAEQPANTVLQVLQKGYLLKQRLLRPALVVVSKSSEN